MCRRDAIDFIDRLKEAGKYVDHEDMPGGGHGYEYYINTKEAKTHIADFHKFWKKYILDQ